MLAKKITYADYDGHKRTETFYFNLTKSEITELQLTYPGGYAEYIEKVVESGDAPELMKMFKDIIRRSYGEKTDDGKRLVKSDELSRAFMETLAYDELFMELCHDADYALKFVAGIMPDFGDDKERLLEETKAKIISMKGDEEN